MEAEEAINGSWLKLPPGFRFSPTDEELILHFLHPISSSSPPSSISTSNSFTFHNIIPNLHPSKLDPWDLNGKALSCGNEYFYFNRLRQNRRTENGYWKDMQMEEPIFSSAANGIKIGTKKLLVFHINGARRGTEENDRETSWVMEEYHLVPTTNKRHRSPVLCRVHERKDYSSSQHCVGWGDYEDGTEISSLDEMFLSLDDDLDDASSSY